MSKYADESLALPKLQGESAVLSKKNKVVGLKAKIEAIEELKKKV